MSELLWTHGHAWPWLLAVPVLWWLLWCALRWGRNGVSRYGAPPTEHAFSPGLRAALWSAGALFLLLTWMEPLLGEEKVAVERRGLDIVFCLDTSRSMLARDMEPDRLERAKRDIKTVLPHLVGGDRVALLAFAGKTRLVVPLTHDLDSFRFLLEPVATDPVRTGGTDLAGAIHRGLEIADPKESSTTVLVLLTDGEDLTGAGRQAAAEAAAKGVIVHTVGYGSTRGSKITIEKNGSESFLQSDEGEEVISALDTEGLRKIAQATGGEFVRADVMALPLVELKEKRIDPMLKRAYEAGEDVMHKTRFQWTLLPAVVALLLELLLHGGKRR